MAQGTPRQGGQHRKGAKLWVLQSCCSGLQQPALLMGWRNHI